jgi:hypothetical protein
MEMATTATSSCTATMRAFPLKYFVLAFTWLFWGLQLLSMRNVIPTLPGLTVIGTFGPLVAAVLALGASRQDAGKGEGRQEFMGGGPIFEVRPSWPRCKYKPI